MNYTILNYNFIKLKWLWLWLTNRNVDNVPTCFHFLIEIKLSREVQIKFRDQFENNFKNCIKKFMVKLRCF